MVVAMVIVDNDCDSYEFPSNVEVFDLKIVFMIYCTESYTIVVRTPYVNVYVPDCRFLALCLRHASSL